MVLPKEQEEKDKRLVEDFYKLLPMLLSLLDRATSDDIPLPFPIAFDSDPIEKLKGFISFLISAYEDDKHLDLNFLHEIDKHQLSPEVQRLIKSSLKQG